MQPIPISRNTAILIAIACLVVGLGLGFLLKKGGPIKIDIDRPAVSSSTAPKATSAPRVTSRTFKEENPGYSVEVEYPELVDMADGGVQAKVNNRIKADVFTQVAGFHAQSASNPALGGEGLRSMFAAKYKVALLTRSFFSGSISYSDYSAGAAHPSNYLVALNYDLKTGEPLTLDQFLKNLRPASGYFARLGEHVTGELVRKLGGGQDQLEAIRAGASPTAENYANFTVDGDGLTILFDPYQVAPYAAGAPEIKIPYAVLMSKILKSAPASDGRASSTEMWWLE